MFYCEMIKKTGIFTRPLEKHCLARMNDARKIVVILQGSGSAYNI